MEHREDGLLVDYSGAISKQASGERQGNQNVFYNEKQERELATFSQETALMRAFNEIREYAPKSMTTLQREMFNVMCEKIFAKHGLTAATYQQYFGHLGTTSQLHR